MKTNVVTWEKHSILGFNRAVTSRIPKPPLIGKKHDRCRHLSLECYPVGVAHIHELTIQELEGAWLTLAPETGSVNHVKKEPDREAV